MNSPTTSSGSDSPQARRTFADAVRFDAVVIVVALLVLGLALWWVSGCKSGSGADPLAHCTRLQRNTLAIGAPLILSSVVSAHSSARFGCGGPGAVGRTWQGAGWLLLMLMLVVLGMTAPVALL